VNRLVYEYTNTELSATGDRISVSRLSCHAASTNKAEEMHVNIQTNHASTWPDGNARPAVRGFAASMWRSAILLNAIAADLAPTIATVIQMSLSTQNQTGLGPVSRAARVAPRNANGSANRVCSILIISSVIRNRLIAVIVVFGRQRAWTRSMETPDVALPHGFLRMGKTQMIHYPVYEMVDKRYDVMRFVIKGGHRRHNHRASLPQLDHVFQVNG